MKNKKTLVLLFSLFASTLTKSNEANNESFTVLDTNQYKLIVNQTRHEIQHLLNGLKAYRQENADFQVGSIVHQLLDRPYLYKRAMGEGDWQPASRIYQPGAVHVQQNPVYRTDGFDCQSFVQTALALFYAKTLNEFDRNILSIAYGGAGDPKHEIVRFYNRNNFVDGDFNPVNQRNGLFTDVTVGTDLSSYAAFTKAKIERQNWFLFQQKHLSENVMVLNKNDGPKMVRRFQETYGHLSFPHFQSEEVTIAYLPKMKLAVPKEDRHFEPNQALLDKIPTPSVAEIVVDAKKWNINGINIKKLIGTELNISHLGLLYRQHFQRGEVIYHRINCRMTQQNKNICDVNPVRCNKTKCTELMFVHATNAYPNRYYWYQLNGKYVCSSEPPPRGIVRRKCNRVESLPLFNYLTSFQYRSYRYMNNPGLLGIHVEKLKT